MRRREPTPAGEEGTDGLPPERLRRFLLAEWIDNDAKPPTDAGSSWRYWNARKRWREAGEAWCEARELSYCMTFLGWRRPCPSEQAAGRTAGLKLPRPVDRGWPRGMDDPRRVLAEGR